MFWPPTRGDALNQVERFTFAGGLTAANTFRGMLFGELTATAVKLYKTYARAPADLVLTGLHGQALSTGNTSFPIVTLAAANTSGIEDVTLYCCAKQAFQFEVWPTFATDTELRVRMISLDKWPKSSGTTFLDQHKLAMERLVKKLMQAQGPRPPGSRITGTQRGDVADLWVVNQAGDYELKRLQNLDAYREFCEHYALAMIFRTGRVVGTDTQLELIADEDKLAEDAFAEVFPLADADQDMDADIELPRYRLYRG